MSMTLSSAAAKAAKADQADFTAPVAANNSAIAAAAANSANNTRSAPVAKPAPASNGATAGNANNTKNTQPAAAKPSTTAQNTPGRQAAPAAQPPERNSAADAAAQLAQAAADAVPVVAPLFSQLLNLTDVTAAGDDSKTDTSTDVATDATGSGSATASAVLPAMVSSMLNLATPVPATPVASTDSDAGRIDAISATSTLNASATRLNLAAASVAVMPSAPVSDDNAAAQVNANQAAVPQNIYNLANNATLAAAAARQLQGDASAATSDTPVPAVDTAAPVATDTVASDTPVIAANTLRVAPRSADVASSTASTSASAAPAPGFSSAASKDDSSHSFATTAASTTVNVNQSATPATTSQGATTVKLAGTPDQWQQPLRDALGDRLQVQLQRNNDHAVIRLEPLNMGSIEISIRHSAGALQVNLSANNSEVVRQLNTIGDSVRQDLSNKQFVDVAVTVSSSRAQAQADQGGQNGKNGQQRGQDDGRTPGRALSDDDSTATFAMTGE
ncbi:flagellar hook-length control protein FliK [Duganella sp. CY15W]|uniref:flagellar hook-length control protein FliK n=1 Tax=Duganella sp. CY15W TaxID=2692172 RepID=UPI0013707B3F|nr:flagellar hook-length control protein FliK [Duganella sp. CY15W]MYM27777.1 flagellar hook-length control protein FliK [Duganella sp. CY15W]